MPIVITMPPAMARSIDLSIGQITHGIVETSETTGAQSERVLGPPQWTMSLRSAPAMSLDEGAWWETTLLRLRGGVNVLAAWDTVRAQPRGTLRGSPTILDAQAGASGLTLQGITPGRTLMMGDWLQVGAGLYASQLVKVVETASAAGSGQMAVWFEPPLRSAHAAGTPVTVERAVAHFRMQGNVRTQYIGGASPVGGFAVDLVETWR